MRNFLLLSVSLDILPLLYAISRQPQLWDQHPIRTTHPGTPHGEVSDILCRFQSLEAYNEYGDTAGIMDNHESVPFPAWWALPDLRPLVLGLFTRVQGVRLGRVLLTKLRPGCKIAPHKDSPSHTAYYSRFQITLCTPPECYFHIEDEMVSMHPGECWFIDNSAEHWVINDGATERITLIVDIHCDAMPTQAAVVAAPERARRRRSS